MMSVIDDILNVGVILVLLFNIALLDYRWLAEIGKSLALIPYFSFKRSMNAIDFASISFTTPSTLATR